MAIHCSALGATWPRSTTISVSTSTPLCRCTVSSSSGCRSKGNTECAPDAARPRRRTHRIGAALLRPLTPALGTNAPCLQALCISADRGLKRTCPVFARTTLMTQSDLRAPICCAAQPTHCRARLRSSALGAQKVRRRRATTREPARPQQTFKATRGPASSASSRFQRSQKVARLARE
jgi:hypothetical protein